MTELKTLKDLGNNLSTSMSTGKDTYTKIFSERELKQEAIKWVKLCEEHLKETDDNDKEAVMFLNGEIFAFTKFFNLTEEDLI